MTNSDHIADSARQEEEGLRFDLVVFDLVGTLIDISATTQYAINVVLRDYGSRELTRATAARLIGGGPQAIVRRVLQGIGISPDSGTLRHVVRRYRIIEDGEASHLTEVYPGVSSTLNELQRHGCRLAVCTRGRSSRAEHTLERLGLKHFFAVIAGGDDSSARKPHPRHLLRILEELEVSHDKAVVVGDRSNDVAMARAAQVPVIIAAYGFPDMHPKIMDGDRIIARMSELLEALSQL